MSFQSRALAALKAEHALRKANTVEGNRLRLLREQSRYSLRQFALKLGVSAPYLSDLELGRRNWTPERIAQFEAALKS